MPQPPSIPELAGLPFVLPWPIQWGDQDMFGHVNNVVYFRWLESARIAFFQESGLADLMAKSGVAPILASIKCNYRRQLRYPDTVHISASVVKLGRSSMQMNHLIYSESLGAVAADGESTVVVFDYAAQRSAPIPDDVRARIDQFERRNQPGG